MTTNRLTATVLAAGAIAIGLYGCGGNGVSTSDTPVTGAPVPPTAVGGPTSTSGSTGGATGESGESGATKKPESGPNPRKQPLLKEARIGMTKAQIVAKNGQPKITQRIGKPAQECWVYSYNKTRLAFVCFRGDKVIAMRAG